MSARSLVYFLTAVSCAPCWGFLIIHLRFQLVAQSVDPRDDRVIATASDHSQCCHPLQHAVMACIDEVARAQGGGAWTDIVCSSKLASLSDWI